jgi:hypothetical protein
MKYKFLLHTYVLPEHMRKTVTVKSEVIMVVTAKNAVFYNVTLCSVVKVYGRFREASCCHHHQGRWISYSRHTHLPWWKRPQDPWTICHPIQGDISLHNVDYNKMAVCLASVCRRTDTNLFRHSNGTAKGIYCTVWKIFTVCSDTDTTNSRHQCRPVEDTGHSAKKFTPPPKQLTLSLTGHMSLP